MMKYNYTKAVEGQRVTLNLNSAGEFEVEVKPKCTVDRGNWYCCTCKMMLVHQLDKDAHVSDGKKHVLAWWCHEHSELEVP